MKPPAEHGYIDYVDDEEHFWRIETLWRAAAVGPVVETALDDLPWKVDGCFILGDPPTWGAFAEHCRRSLAADCSFPIILSPAGEVMDGMHRIVRAFVEGRTTLPTVTLTEVPPPDRIRPRRAAGE